MDIKTQIKRILNNIQHSGDYCGGGKLHLGLPNVIINNVGPLVFPLVETQACLIIDRCGLAPFGYRNQTLYDIGVRHTWQLEPKDLDMDNPIWSDQTIIGLKEIIINDLGLQRTKDEIEIELYKVLLYEKGSFFKTHRDTEKKDGMFATLLIILPSFYTGGKLIVQHQKCKKEFDFSEDTQNIHYVVLYADCEHELLPVTGGYRLVLAYNVILLPKSDNKQINESEHNMMLVNQLNEVFTSWLDTRNNDTTKSKSPRKLIIPLDHEYTQASMKNGPLLKGKDAVVGEIVRFACENEKNRLLLYCIMLERSDEVVKIEYHEPFGKPFGEPFGEPSDEEIKIEYYEPFGEPSEPFTQYCTILGYQHQEKVSIASTDLLDENIWNKLKLKIVQGPWTGNEAEYSHRWYNLSALLLLPRKNRYDLILCLSKQNSKFVYNINYELWTVLSKLEECKPSDDNSMVTSATLDLIIEGIHESGFELTHMFRIALLHCLVALALLNKTNQEITIIIQKLIEQNLLIREFFSAFSTAKFGMYERMAEILFNIGNLFGWTLIADQVLSLFREELQSSKYSSENALEEKLGHIVSFLLKFISLIKTKRDDNKETTTLQELLTKIIDIFSMIVIPVVQQIISNEPKQTKDKNKIERHQYYSLYRNSTFSIKSLCSFLKVLTMVDIDLKTNQILDDIIDHIQILIDHDSNNSRYRSLNSEYETTVDSMIKDIINPVIYPFLKEIYPHKASWYFALIDFCQTIVKSQLEMVQMNIEKAHTIFQNIRLTCSCRDCQYMIMFLQDSSRHEYKCKYRQYRTQSHVYSSINKLNLPVRLNEGKFIKDINLYNNQKQYTELMANLKALHH